MSHCHDTDPADLVKGAYITLNPHHNLGDGSIFFSPEIRETCEKAAAMLSVQGIVMRLVCVKDWGLFLAQDDEYRAHLTSCPPFFAPDFADWVTELGARPLTARIAGEIAQEIRQAIYGE